jgi:hypothetical protein
MLYGDGPVACQDRRAVGGSYETPSPDWRCAALGCTVADVLEAESLADAAPERREVAAGVRNHLHRTLAAFDADLRAATGALPRAAATGVAPPDPEPRSEPDGQEGSPAGQPAALRFPG